MCEESIQKAEGNTACCETLKFFTCGLDIFHVELGERPADYLHAILASRVSDDT